MADILGQQGAQAIGVTPPLPSLKASPEAAMAAYQKAQTPIIAKRKAEVEDYQKKLEGNAAEQNAATGDLAATLEKGQQHGELPEKVKFTPTDIQQSMGWILAAAAFSGLASRQPLTASMNAMAGLVEGAKAGDDARFQKAHVEFQENMQKYLEQEKQYHDKFQNIVDSKKMSLTQKTEAARLLAVEHQNKMGEVAAEGGDLDGAYQNYYKSLTHYEHLQNLAQKERHFHAQHEASKPVQFTGKDGKTYLQRTTAENTIQVFDATTGRAVDPSVSGYAQQKGANPKLGEERAAAMGIQLRLANQEIADLSAGGMKNMPLAGDIHFDQSGPFHAVGRLGIKKAMTDEEQQLVTAAQLFAEAAGHLQSGARLTQSAFERTVRQFIPQPGDEPGALKLKLAHRNAIVEGSKILSGSLYDKTKNLGLGTSDGSVEHNGYHFPNQAALDAYLAAGGE